ncbi:GNAT family N-acetyltransferase [Streptomyces sp. NPDC059009]|uniref:GNAT family N-acetyltransferase n=1 Tax=Streptomyces sp. NPDC059009 TaxID=3346694 RepID=UPI0036B316D5
MPFKIPDVVAPGTFAAQEQPTIPAPGAMVLRPWSTADAPAVHEAFQDRTLQYWHGYASTSADEVVGLIEGWRTEWTEERDAYWAIADAGSDALLGRVALRQISLSDGRAEVAYWTVPPARGRGIAPRAVTALTHWAFHEIGLHRLELTHATGNEASCRVAHKTGFTAEGTKRSALLHEDGWHDMHLHARVRDDAAPRTDQPAPVR